MAAQSKRIIMRVDVSAGTPERLYAAVERFLSTNISVGSRAIDWFLKQDEEVQAAILRVMPPTKDIDIQRRLLKAIQTRG